MTEECIEYFQRSSVHLQELKNKNHPTDKDRTPGRDLVPMHDCTLHCRHVVSRYMEHSANIPARQLKLLEGHSISLGGGAICEPYVARLNRAAVGGSNMDTPA